MIDKKIRQIIEGKDLAIVGNASSIYNKPRPIDNHEVVIRINKGFPKKGIGQKTDILALSLPLDEDTIKKHYDPKVILWCTPKHELMNEYLRENAVKFSLEDWEILNQSLGARPSTGLMTIWYMTHACKSITLYGFDFWKSPNWYTDKIHKGPHCPVTEEIIIRAIIESIKGKIII